MSYIIHGEEQYQVRKAMDALIRQLIGQRDDLNTIIYDATQTDSDTVLADAQTIPFFTDKKCIIVQNADFLTANDTPKWDTEALIQYIKTPLPSTVLILSTTAAKLDMRKKSVKQLVSLCKVTVCNRLDQGSLPAYVKEQLAKRGIKLSYEALACLCERLPFDIAVIQNELDKLALYGGTLDESAIQALVSRSLEEDVFALVNAAAQSDHKRMFAIWEDLQLQNKDPIYLIALLSSQFHLFYQVKNALRQGMHAHDEIAQELGVHPYRVKLAIRGVERFSLDSLMEILANLAQLDQSIKSGAIDKKLGFELFLLRIGA